MVNIADIEVQVVRKRVKRINLAIYPPDGRVRISVPYQVSNAHVRKIILSRLDWIKEKQAYFQRRPPAPVLHYITGEMHALFGKQYSLQVIHDQGRQGVLLNNNGILKLCVKRDAPEAIRQKLLDEWYRDEMKLRLPFLIAKWEPLIGKEVSECRIRKMRTRWGTCHIIKRRIWLNLELAKRPAECLEYVMVHEMVHLLERNHTSRFYRFMDHFLPDWRVIKDRLNEFSQ
jgi:predicted metal-dependent hydrolase